MRRDDLPGDRLGRAEQQPRERSHGSFVSSPGDGSDNGLLRGHSSASQKVLTTLPSTAKDEGFVAAEQFRNELDGFLSFARRQLRECPRNLVRRTHEATSSNLVQEGHVLHRFRFGLPVHFDSMPTIQHQGLVVGVTDLPIHEHRGPAYHAPPPHAIDYFAGFGADLRYDLAIRIGRDAIRCEPGVPVDLFSPISDEPFGDVRAGAPALQRFIPEGMLLVDLRGGRRHEEPFALAESDRGMPAEARLQPETLPFFGERDAVGLEGEFRLRHCGCRGGLKDRGDEPMPLIVPAQELGLLATDAMQKQKMPIFGGINHCELTLPQHHVEELAVPVSANIDFDWSRLSDGRATERKTSTRLAGLSPPFPHLDTGADYLKWLFKCVHRYPPIGAL